MSSFKPKQFILNNVNNGNKYEDGEGIQPSTANDIVEGVAYCEEQRQAMVQSPAVVENGGNVGVKWVDTTINGRTHKKLQFENIKGDKGEKGKDGTDGKDGAGKGFKPKGIWSALEQYGIEDDGVSVVIYDGSSYYALVEEVPVGASPENDLYWAWIGAGGGEVNKIDTVKVNGSALTIADKAVNIVLADVATSGHLKDLDGRWDLSAIGGSAGTAIDQKAYVNNVLKANLSFGTLLSEGELNYWYISGKKDGNAVCYTDAIIKFDASKRIIGTRSTITSDSNLTLTTKDYVDSKVPNTREIAGKQLNNDITKADLLSAINVADGAQVNVIETVKVNGSNLQITDKAVNITVPSISGLESTSNKKDTLSDSMTEYPSMYLLNSEIDYIANRHSVVLGFGSGKVNEQDYFYNYVVIGRDAKVNKKGSISIGDSSLSMGENEVILGAYAKSDDKFSYNNLACGYLARILNASVYSSAIGPSSEVSSGYYSTAIGYNAKVTSSDSDKTMRLGASDLSALKCAVALTTSSDTRDKADINAIDSKKCLDIISQVEPIQYVRNDRNYYIDSETKEFDQVAYSQQTKKGDRIRVGVKAQQLKQVLDTVFENDNHSDIVYDNHYDAIKKGEEPIGENKLEMSYSKLVPILIGAIQELQKEIEELKNDRK